MEKFKKFADPQTMINVFVPAFANHNTSIIERLFHCTFGFALIVIRLPILIILFTLAFILNSILRIRFLNKVIFRTILFTMGFINIDNQSPISEQENTLVFSNHTSPIDYIYFIYKCNPSFVLDKQLSFWETLRQIFILERPQGLTSEIGEKTSVVFFEGCQTNGLGILTPPPNLLNIKRPFNLYYLQYPNRGLFTPINTTRNQLWHLIIICTNLTNKLKVSSLDTTHSSDYGKLIRTFYDAEGVKVINQNWTTSIDFREYYASVMKQGYAKKSN